MLRWFFIYPLIFIFALAVSWKYLPDVFREKAGAFIGGGISRSTGTITNAFGEEIVLYGDPKERRQTLIAELKKNVAEIRRQTITEETVDDEAPVSADVSAGESAGTASLETQSQKNLVRAAEEIIKELEEANDDATVRERIVERILEKFLPEKEVICKTE